MRAVVFTGGSYQVSDVPEVSPGPGEVAVSVAYAGVMWGDVLVRRGAFPVPEGFVPGFEAAGEIVAVGEGVDPSRIGERVVALTTSGAYAERAVLPSAFALPAGDVPLREAAGFGWAGPTAYDLVNTAARVGAGESVLVLAAAGGVGSLAVQFARLAGAGRIVGVVSTPEKAAYAKGLGYDEVVTELPAADAFDVVLDSVGGEVRAAAMELLAPHGRLVAYGEAAGAAPTQIDVSALTAANRGVIGYGSFALSQRHPEILAASARRALDLVLGGQVSVQVTAEYGLEDLSEAVRRLEDRSSFGKAVIRVGSGVHATPGGPTG